MSGFLGSVTSADDLTTRVAWQAQGALHSHRRQKGSAYEHHDYCAETRFLDVRCLVCCSTCLLSDVSGTHEHLLFQVLGTS